MKKNLITGIAGFAGSFLAEYLLRLGDCQIVGTTLSLHESPNVSQIKDTIQLVPVNLLEEEKIETLIADIKPDFIYHLAALASPAKSFSHPTETIVNNIQAELNILEAVKKAELKNTKILVISSADIYGLLQPEDLPVDEDTPMRPNNPYAVSKIAQDYLGLQYFITYKLPIIRVRPFNHIGSRQAGSFAISDFSKRIVDIEKGNTPPVLKVGNLEAKRDFTDVRDMVKAYVLAIEKGEPGEVYNIGSGIAHKMSDIVAMMQKMSSVPFTLEQDPAFMRPSDNPELCCDNTKFVALTGWKPEIPLEQTLKDTLDYWRNIV